MKTCVYKQFQSYVCEEGYWNEPLLPLLFTEAIVSQGEPQSHYGRRT